MSDSAPGPILRLAGAPLTLLDRARIYACGITPYDVTHLGHAATFVWIDLLTRVLRADGVETVLCRNVTDVDDVLFDAADRAGAEYDQFASMQQFHFDRDMHALGVRPPQFEPRARRHIAAVIALASGLVSRDLAYERGGSVYFRGAGVPAAAGLEPQVARTRSAEFGDEPDDPAKDNPFDVAVWRASGAGRPGWDSPWGRGRPGWHAECAAMSISVLGSVVDVHCGGADLSYPHHPYQAAIAESFTGVAPYARAHLAVGTVRLDGAKMAKSTGNLVLVSELLAKHPAAALRLHLLDRQWALPWDHDEAGLAKAADRLDRLYAAAGRRDSASETATGAVLDALRNDLDVPAALNVAEDSGGEAARTAIALLGLAAQV